MRALTYAHGHARPLEVRATDDAPQSIPGRGGTRAHATPPSHTRRATHPARSTLLSLTPHMTTDAVAHRRCLRIVPTTRNNVRLITWRPATVQRAHATRWGSWSSRSRFMPLCNPHPTPPPNRRASLFRPAFSAASPLATLPPPPPPIPPHPFPIPTPPITPPSPSRPSLSQ